MIGKTTRTCVWYCINCANPVSGLMNAKGEAKAVCGKCHAVMVRKRKNPQKSSLEWITPSGMTKK